MNKHRYFIFGEGRIIWLPPCASNSGNCWVHYADGGIEREHAKPGGLDIYQEVTEEARKIDPEIFSSTVDLPFRACDTEYSTYKAFYDDRYKMRTRERGNDA